MRYREVRILNSVIYDKYNNKLSKYLEKEITCNERIISIIAEYNKYGDIYAYQIYIEAGSIDTL